MVNLGNINGDQAANYNHNQWIFTSPIIAILNICQWDMFPMNKISWDLVPILTQFDHDLWIIAYVRTVTGLAGQNHSITPLSTNLMTYISNEWTQSRSCPTVYPYQVWQQSEMNCSHEDYVHGWTDGWTDTQSDSPPFSFVEWEYVVNFTSNSQNKSEILTNPNTALSIGVRGHQKSPRATRISKG